MLAMNLFFWGGWTPSTGRQNPPASRYRGGYRANYVTGAAVLLATLLWLH